MNNPTTFAELVASNGLGANLNMQLKYGDSVPMHHRVLRDKFEKHEANPRKLAMYLALFAWSYPGEKPPQAVLNAAKRAGLTLGKSNGKVAVGYNHQDGTIHWFTS